jgi:acetylornithine deacetylase/succinyl-diaminopimelate desuccinylase-like protein
MKGQVLATFSAIESVMKAGEMPVNLKFLLEGEEEIGSKNLEPFIQKHADKFKADVSLNPDAGMMGPDQPTITYGLRGLAYLEVHVWGPKADLHSGLYGGAVHNPAQALAELIAKMHDEKGRITLPGFYDSVRPLSDQERADFARLPNDDASYVEGTGVPALWGEEGYTSAERTGARPTLEVNGLLSGWTGPGSKTVLPAKAMAKISCRLVPDQQPVDIEDQMVRFMKENAPKTIHWEVKRLTSSPFAIADLNNPGVKAMQQAMESVWGTRPFFRREGGSIGAVAMLQQICGVESVLVGTGMPTDNVHSPNEHLDLPTWYKGIDSFIHFFYNLA